MKGLNTMDIIKTPPASKKYRANFDRIFAKLGQKEELPITDGSIIIKTMEGDIII